MYREQIIFFFFHLKLNLKPGAFVYPKLVGSCMEQGSAFVSETRGILLFFLLLKIEICPATCKLEL